MNDKNELCLYNHRYLRLKNVLELIPVSRSTWYHWIQSGIAPQSIHISQRIAVWKAQDIKDLLDEMGKPEWDKQYRQKIKPS